MHQKDGYDNIKQERQRIAKLLHDTFTQSLFSASAIASALPQMLERRPELIAKYLEELNQELADASKELQEIINTLDSD